MPASRRFTTPGMPIKAVGLRTAKLYQEDIDFIIEHGQHPRTIVREALHAYCEAWRTQLEWVPPLKVVPAPRVPARIQKRVPIPAPDIMVAWSKADRDEYILTGKVPAMRDDHSRAG